MGKDDWEIVIGELGLGLMTLVCAEQRGFSPNFSSIVIYSPDYHHHLYHEYRNWEM